MSRTSSEVLRQPATPAPPALPPTARVDVANPAFDYIPPGLVDLYITNTGAHQPSYIYRLIADSYHPDDRD